MLTVCRRILVNPKSSRVNGLAKSIVATETIRRLQPTFMRHCSYDGDGKSTGKILNIDHSLGLMIDSYSVAGFRLNTDVKVIGPMVIFPRTLLGWNVNTVDDIDEHSLRLLLVLEPRLDILLIGVGNVPISPALLQRLKAITSKYNIDLEVHTTDHAVTLFNFLNAEGRLVAAALIPPHELPNRNRDCQLADMRRKEIEGPDPFLLDDGQTKTLPNK